MPVNVRRDGAERDLEEESNGSEHWCEHHENLQENAVVGTPLRNEGVFGDLTMLPSQAGSSAHPSAEPSQARAPAKSSSQKVLTIEPDYSEMPAWMLSPSPKRKSKRHHSSYDPASISSQSPASNLRRHSAVGGEVEQRTGGTNAFAAALRKRASLTNGSGSAEASKPSQQQSSEIDLSKLSIDDVEQLLEDCELDDEDLESLDGEILAAENAVLGVGLLPPQ
jgi:hypothetical protein